MHKFTGKLGALNLAQQYTQESNIKNREAVISALSSYLRGINTDGKRQFITEYDGINFMKQALINANGHIRLSKKIVLLIQDFVL